MALCISVVLLLRVCPSDMWDLVHAIWIIGVAAAIWGSSYDLVNIAVALGLI